MEFGDLSEDMLGEAPGGVGLLSRLAEYGRTRCDYFDMEQVTRIIIHEKYYADTHPAAEPASVR